ncbi:MAG: hypothetical protein COU63_03765 [Candidatus Pacebacteria bacterium CG10_big_fil_rev_8_21_14_0_10_36_11]|nr:glycoside hydrolase family 3 protein [Candidatus Pacearchaeota archaeon]OIP73858.1 MAG: hypothetical protein AUK08_04865 [Candidatus Pacebacteria bacterium CG2_30_36_39]PIR64579.1 MAG: hypothetical protein COU63_03765 [Candidatus Pacebacteria bacterium CG10_big_fil_rev_8_21_14_0_10_36_11]PJC43002.1 MAG: hypothetical protein CO040_01525 [Candidatus Pacebacteria bacterium CG_4_9_14_0_2_um_filter_36_8]
MKSNSTKTIILILFILTLLSGYNYFYRPFLKKFEAQKAAEAILSNITPEPTISNLQKTINNLSVEEKIWQLISIPISLDNDSEASTETKFISQVNPGFITIFGKNISLETTRNFTNSLPVSLGGYVPLIAVDHEGGTVQRLTGKGFTKLESWESMCEKSEGLRINVFETSARELRSAGVNVVFAPIVDVPRDGSFLKTRACENQINSLITAEDYIKTFGSQGILSVIKHYPGIGSATKDMHFYKTELAIEAQDTAPFQRILADFPNIGVMSSHVIVAGKTDNLPCSLSEVCLNPFPVHFPDVLLFTDALEMASAQITEDGEEKTLGEIAYLAIKAGNHVVVFGEKVSQEEIKQVVNYLSMKYQEEPEFSAKVEASVAKILDLKLPEEIK